MSNVAYLAHPIDNISPAQRATMNHGIVSVRGILAGDGWHVYHPYNAWRVNSAKPDPIIEQVNDTALRAAGVLVAIWPDGVHSTGVPMEIARARTLGIPVVAILGQERRQTFSLQLNDIIVLDEKGDEQDLTEALLKARIRGVLRAKPPHSDLVKVVVSPIRRDNDPPDTSLTLMPARAHDDDAGADLYNAHTTVIQPGEFVDLHTTVRQVQLPEGHWGMVTGRSSTIRLLKLHVPIGVIDPGYRGPLFVGVWNLSPHPATVKAGDRIAQLIVIPNNPAPVLMVNQVDPAPRGLAGFGSSGQ